MLLELRSPEGETTFGLGLDWEVNNSDTNEIEKSLELLFKSDNFLKYLESGGKKLFVYIDASEDNDFVRSRAKELINKKLSKYSVKVLFEKVDSPDNDSSTTKTEIKSIEDVTEVLGEDYKSHWEDAEHFWDVSCYKSYITALIGLSNGEVSFDKIEYSVIGGNQKYDIQFYSGDDSYKVEIENMGDWLDFSLFTKLNSVLRNIGIEKGFYPIVPDKVGDQTLLVVYTSREIYEVLNKSGFVVDYVER